MGVRVQKKGKGIQQGTPPHDEKNPGGATATNSSSQVKKLEKEERSRKDALTKGKKKGKGPLLWRSGLAAIEGSGEGMPRSRDFAATLTGEKGRKKGGEKPPEKKTVEKRRGPHKNHKDGQQQIL